MPRPVGLIGPTRPDLDGATRELHTPRLRLETSRPAHAAAVMASINASLPDLRFISWGQTPADLDWTASFMQRDLDHVDAGQGLAFNAFVRDGGAYAGRVDLHSCDWAVPRGEIGYVADSAHAGQGLMREAVLAVIDLAFGLGFLRVEAISDARNTRALRFAESLGFTREALLRSHDRDPQGALCDEVLFALLHPSLR